MKKGMSRKTSPLHLAARNDYFDLTRGNCNDFGWTPLHIAAKNGHLDVCKLITEALGKAEQHVNPISLPLRLTPLDLAIKYEHIHVQEHLQNLQQALQPDLVAK